ncbi:MAG: hypothetical protein WC637_01050 [Victivallales bacterium]|jgi:hypothetical protein
MDRKLLVLLAVVLFVAGFVVSAADVVPEAKKAAPAAKEAKADKTADAVKTAEVKKDEPKSPCPVLRCPVLRYTYDRFMDLFDIVTVNVGAGPEFGVEAKLTHWMQLGGMYGDKYFLGKDYARQFGGGYSSGWNYDLICLTSERRCVDSTFGTTREFLLKRKSLSLAMPNEDFTYSQKIRDFWEIAVNAGWLITAGVAIHPEEIADFFVGFAKDDPSGDDYVVSAAAVADTK